MKGENYYWKTQDHNLLNLILPLGNVCVCVGGGAQIYLIWACFQPVQLILIQKID